MSPQGAPSPDPHSIPHDQPAATIAGDGELFAMAPLIRLTLVSLYLALVLPLPLLAPQDLIAPLTLAVPLGLALVLAISSERVVLDAGGIRLGHPGWCAWLLRRGWSLSWPEIQGLTPVGTSQGGRVFYVRQRGAGRAYLLPQRLERFDIFLERFAQLSGVDCQGVGRLTPPWTYQLLALLSALLLAGEIVLLVIRPLLG